MKLFLLIIQFILRITAANGGLLPINHHHSKNKKVLTHPERSGDVTTRHEMVNHQLPADWEEFWDDSGKFLLYSFLTHSIESLFCKFKGYSYVLTNMMQTCAVGASYFFNTSTQEVRRCRSDDSYMFEWKIWLCVVMVVVHQLFVHIILNH